MSENKSLARQRIENMSAAKKAAKLHGLTLNIGDFDFEDGDATPIVDSMDYNEWIDAVCGCEGECLSESE